MTDIPAPGEMRELLLRLMRGVNAQVFAGVGNKVLSGPFAGMEIPETTPWEDGNAGTKLLGSYEFELHDAIEKAIARRPHVVVNVGCAEGYYAIGLARRLPDAAVYVRDLDIGSRDECLRYAHVNGVRGRVSAVEGCRSAGELHVHHGPALYVIDCEGAELDLLDPSGCPSLRQADIIVECHDFLNPEISSVLAQRFALTHEVEIIRSRMPPLEQYPLPSASLIMTLLAVVEKRPVPTLWLACWAKRGSKEK